MTYSLINDGDTGLSVRTTLNDILKDANDGKFIANKKENVTLTQNNWTSNNNLYEYEYSDNDIVSGYVVDFVPYNSSVNIVIEAELLPFNAVENEKTVFYARNQPTDNITGELIIFTA